MTSELRPAVEARAEVLDQLLSELQDGNAWDSTISLLTDYADLVQDLLKDREAVRAEQAAELAKWKALAETLAGALGEIEKAPAWGYPDKWETTPAQVRILARQALTSYKEQRDD